MLIEFLQMVMENNGNSPEAVASVFLLCEVFLSSE